MIQLPHKTHSFFAVMATVFLVIIACAAGIGLVAVQQQSPSAGAASVILSSPLTVGHIEAKAAIIYDPSDGRILFEKSADEQLPLASVTKLMTAEIVLAKESANTPVRITADDLAPDGDWGFKVGDVVVLQDLLKIGLIASSNDAMQAAAESLGPDYIGRMNEVATNLGLTKTYFYNPTGLDVSTSTSGAYASAYDVARLAALFYKQYPFYFELTQSPSVSIQDGSRTLTAAATALPLLSIPGFIGAKTGYTDLAGGNLVAIFDVEIGHPLVAVVLGSSESGRFTDIRTLINTADSSYNQSTP